MDKTASPSPAYKLDATEWEVGQHVHVGRALVSGRRLRAHEERGVGGEEQEPERLAHHIPLRGIREAGLGAEGGQARGARTRGSAPPATCPEGQPGRPPFKAGRAAPSRRFSAGTAAASLG